MRKYFKHFPTRDYSYLITINVVFVFREVEKKVNLTWESDGTVSYRRVKYRYFERNMSVGPLTDTVTTINVPVVGSAEFVRGEFFMEWGLSDMLSAIQVKGNIY